MLSNAIKKDRTEKGTIAIIIYITNSFLWILVLQGREEPKKKLLHILLKFANSTTNTF